MRSRIKVRSKILVDVLKNALAHYQLTHELVDTLQIVTCSTSWLYASSADVLPEVSLMCFAGITFEV